MIAFTPLQRRRWCRAACLAAFLACAFAPGPAAAIAPLRSPGAAAARSLRLEAGDGRLSCSGSQLLRIRLEGDRDGIEALTLGLAYDPRVLAIEHLVAPAGRLRLSRLPIEPAGTFGSSDAAALAYGAGTGVSAGSAGLVLKLEPRRQGSPFPETLVTLRLRALVAGSGQLWAFADALGSAGAPSTSLRGQIDLEVVCPGMTPVPPQETTDLEAAVRLAEAAPGADVEAGQAPALGAAAAKPSDWMPAAPASLPIAGAWPPGQDVFEPCHHRLAFGESLSELARARGLDLAELLRANRGIPLRRMRPGTQLRIPGCAPARPARFTVPGAREG